MSSTNTRTDDSVPEMDGELDPDLGRAETLARPSAEIDSTSHRDEPTPSNDSQAPTHIDSRGDADVAQADVDPPPFRVARTPSGGLTIEVAPAHAETLAALFSSFAHALRAPSV